MLAIHKVKKYFRNTFSLFYQKSSVRKFNIKFWQFLPLQRFFLSLHYEGVGGTIVWAKNHWQCSLLIIFSDFILPNQLLSGNFWHIGWYKTNKLSSNNFIYLTLHVLVLKNYVKLSWKIPVESSNKEIRKSSMNILFWYLYCWLQTGLCMMEHFSSIS